MTELHPVLGMAMPPAGVGAGMGGNIITSSYKEETNQGKKWVAE